MKNVWFAPKSLGNGGGGKGAEAGKDSRREAPLSRGGSLC